MQAKFSLPGAAEDFAGCKAGKRLKQSHFRSSPGGSHPSTSVEDFSLQRRVVLVREEILWTDLSWNEISSKIRARKPQNPVGQKCVASNELSALGGEPEAKISQIILHLELPLAATCWSDGMCAPSPESLDADVAGTDGKIILKEAESCQASITNVVEILRLSVWAWDITPAFCHLPLINPFSQDWDFLFQQHLVVPPRCANQFANKSKIKAN